MSRLDETVSRRLREYRRAFWVNAWLAVLNAGAFLLLELVYDPPGWAGLIIGFCVGGWVSNAMAASRDLV